MSDTPLVLVADDDPALQNLLTLGFEREGFDVVVCNDGEEAVAHLETADRLPDVVVVDLLMPGIDGLEFLRHRAEIDRLAAIPAIVLTGFDDEEALAEAYELGADDYVTKPFSPSALVSRVRHLRAD